jgi:NadR type nicotinamide-nucleotide adenylyltransferase
MIMKKVVVIGPESTGKSTLCSLLAQHYNTLWSPEFARNYLLEHGTDYSFDDLMIIGKGQLALEEENTIKAANENKTLLFIDTDMYVMKVWCEFVFEKCHAFILDEIVNKKYDLYLLCNVDLPWVKDELREYPDNATREKLYHIYKDIMVNQQTPWADISGNYETRLAIAIKAIDGMK